jgi:hypothetical protein
MKIKPLEQRWEHLMSLCASEARYLADGTHPRLRKLLAAEITELATEMGFSQRCIDTREFRAERENGRIVRILRDG